MNIAPCSCGKSVNHVIARRRTADGKCVSLWADGSLSWGIQSVIKGSAMPRTAAQQDRALRAGWLVIGEVELYDADDVSNLIAAARWAADRDGQPGTVRTRLASTQKPKLRPNWTTIQADRDGHPVCRAWVLPRIMYPGLAIWHERGRYELMRQLNGARDTYEATGIAGSTLQSVLRRLPGLTTQVASYS